MKTTFAAVMGLLLALISQAQKLPNIQQTSLYAPENVKIDGKADEWGNQFQAYNHATDIFYTISNDDDNLYVVVQATDAVVIKKIIYGNITLTVNQGNKASKNIALSVTYPSIERKNQGSIIQNKNKLVSIANDAAVSKTNDSLIAVLNTQMLSLSGIKVSGIVSFKDSLLTANNTMGIKAMALMDHSQAYTCEIAVPLKYLKAAGVTNDKLKYNIKLNGLFYNTNTTVQLSADGQSTLRSTPGYPSLEMKNTPETLVLDYATDLSGEYTLAKK
ncbi:hypothetical protein [uncultured Mucilaginibacter sp.]|uniref:hypothetical protein n=1 Tax=uncultured Mucilaginibacter sp. TaxID=797541 RepID=UPI0025FC1063|nr:hypothetical protein [uncultured Mucilaginibacter sp.]